MICFMSFATTESSLLDFVRVEAPVVKETVLLIPSFLRLLSALFLPMMDGFREFDIILFFCSDQSHQLNPKLSFIHLLWNWL